MFNSLKADDLSGNLNWRSDGHYSGLGIMSRAYGFSRGEWNEKQDKAALKRMLSDSRFREDLVSLHRDVLAIRKAENAGAGVDTTRQRRQVVADRTWELLEVYRDGCRDALDGELSAGGR